MVIKEDNSFRDIREKSVLQWLDAMRVNEVLEVRGGVRATTDYINGLKEEVLLLKKSNEVKAKYLKKIKMKVANVLKEQ